MTIDSEIANVIEDLLRYPESSILFVGAGAGIPSPTNLPGGADVSNYLLYHLCEGIPEAFDSYFGTVGCQIISDSVNHTSRHHYPGGEDRYWWKEKGKYKLFDPSTDKQD